MPLQSNPLGEILLWSGWLSSGWRWALSPEFRARKRSRWRELPKLLVILDVAGSLVVWVAQVGLVILLLRLAFRN